MNTCLNCGEKFEITEADQAVFQEFKVPEPKLCRLCGHQQRFAFRNERTLYSRACGKCSKATVSVFAPEKPYTIYCRECFFSDGFDPLAYGREFDFSRPFFEQFQELMLATPQIALMGGTNCINSDYINLETDDKNCYMNIGGHFNEDCYYNTFCLYGKNCVDNYWVFRSELVYESSDCHNCYQCFFCRNVTDSNECWFCYDCRGCTNCFGCVNLRNKQYHIFNKPYSKEEYFKKIKEFTGGFTALEKAREGFLKEKLKHPHRFAFQVNCENVTGNYITNSKNVQLGFDSSKAEDSRDIFIDDQVKNMYFSSHIGWAEKVYGSMGGGIKIYDIAFCMFCFPALSFSRYCIYSTNSEYCFGCINLKKNKYCILNRQYTKEEYEKFMPRIVEHMQKTGEWGEFFPPRISFFGYNETTANTYFPLTKEQALAKGFYWWDKMSETTGKETVRPEYLPESITEVGDDILKQILACMDCGKNYKIIKQELEFYKRMGLPIPRHCPHCRYMRRMQDRGLTLTLHPRKCMCDQAGHSWHTGMCKNEFETSYAPERPEIIYCEQCYQSEIV